MEQPDARDGNARGLRVALLLALAAALLFLGADALAPAGATDLGGTDDVIPGRYIVRVRDGTSADGSTKLLSARYGFDADHTYKHVLSGFAATLSDETAQALRHDPNVLSVEPDRIVRIADETLGTGVDRIDAEPPGAINDSGPARDVDIAVLDTGVDVDHPDLNVAGGMASYA
ncbi:MAG: S8 family serine peptidase, partial [Dehalococcoidia bacterium]|nr:S8 family serine peptidase [Dehalococcoidia bacterium]